LIIHPFSPRTFSLVAWELNWLGTETFEGVQATAAITRKKHIAIRIKKN